MLEFAINSFVLLFVVVDPVGLAPLFAALAQGSPPAQRRRMAYKAVLTAAAVLFFFTVAGNALLDYLGVGMPAFGIAGGILLFLVAVDMVFARSAGYRTNAAEQAEAERRQDIGVFPIGVPMIAGPAAMTTVLLLLGGSGLSPRMAVLLLVLALVLALTLALLLAAERLTHLLGETGANVIRRVFGVILAALAVQFVINGVQAVI